MTHCRVNKSYDSKRMGKLWHWTSCTKINRLWFPELRRICPKSVWYLNLAKYCLRIAFSLDNGSFQKFPQMCALCKISERSVDWKVVKDRRDFARFQFTKVFLPIRLTVTCHCSWIMGRVFIYTGWVRVLNGKYPELFIYYVLLKIPQWWPNGIRVSTSHP